MTKRREKAATDREVLDALPARRSALAVMAALADGALPGFEILERANAGLARPLLGPGTLYRLLRDMRLEHLIARVDAPEDGAQDERRQYHELTRFGAAVLRGGGATAAHTRRGRFAPPGALGSDVAMDAEGLYRHLLMLLPPSFRADPEAELLEVFRDASARAAATSRIERVRFWLVMVLDVVATAAMEWQAMLRRRGTERATAVSQTHGVSIMNYLGWSIRYLARESGTRTSSFRKEKGIHRRTPTSSSHAVREGIVKGKRDEPATCALRHRTAFH